MCEPVTVTWDLSKQLWQRFCGVRGPWRADRFSEGKFRAMLLNADLVYHLRWGFLWVSCEGPRWRYFVHPVFWSPPRGLTGVLGDMAKRLQVEHLWAAIPDGVRSLRKLACRVGFVRTGESTKISFPSFDIPATIWVWRV